MKFRICLAIGASFGQTSCRIHITRVTKGQTKQKPNAYLCCAHSAVNESLTRFRVMSPPSIRIPHRQITTPFNTDRLFWRQIGQSTLGGCPWVGKSNSTDAWYCSSKNSCSTKFRKTWFYLVPVVPSPVLPATQSTSCYLLGLLRC